MIAGPSFEAIASLADSTIPIIERLGVAKRLKSFLVGQDLRKEVAVKNAVIPQLANIIARIPRERGKRNSNTHPAPSSFASAPDRTPEEDLCLQAIVIASSLASAGQHFLTPLCAANIPNLLVDALSFNVEHILVKAALQALLSFARLWAIADESPDPNYDLWSTIFNAESVKYFNAVLKSPDPALQPQISLIISLIAQLGDDRDCPASIKSLVAHHGLIDTLAVLLVQHAGQAGNISSHTSAPFSPHVGARCGLSNIIAAISAIISGSNYRAHCFILSPAIRELFIDRGSDTRTRFGPRQGFHNGHECQLPPLHIPISRTVVHASREPANFPALALFHENVEGSELEHIPLGASDIDHSNALCGWLLVFARFLQGVERLEALHFLALIVNAIESDPAGASHESEYLAKTHERVRQLALLAVPLAVNLVRTASEAPHTECDDLYPPQTRRLLRARACATLALLIESNKHLQIAAVQAKAIDYVTPILRKSFDTYTPNKSMWSSRRDGPETPSALPTSTLGARGLQLEFLSIMSARAGALQAIAAIASREDLHRQAIIDSGAISCIVDALKPFPSEMLAHPFRTNGADASLKPADGNTTPVIVAACRAAQKLSRSVAVLRTSLLDGGIVVPLVFLLKYHPSLEVQIAATDVACNLVATFSPMRSELIPGGGAGGEHGGEEDFGLLQTLVDHAKGDSAALRLSSLWCLKNFAQDCEKSLKVAMLDRLDLTWLLGIIRGEQDTRSGERHAQRETIGNGGGVSVGELQTPNALGERVSLMNPQGMEVDEDEEVDDEEELDDLMEDDEEVQSDHDLDLNEDSEEDDEDDDRGPGESRADNDDGGVLYDAASSTHYQSSHIRSTLSAPAPAFDSRQYLSSIRHMEQDQKFNARRDEAEIQVHALDIIRNMINGDDALFMLDQIATRLGGNISPIYDLLVTKLSPLDTRCFDGPGHATDMAAATKQPTKVYNSTPLVHAAIQLLTNLSNPSPAQRQSVASHTALLSALLPHFSHSDARVRTSAVWVINSLTWTEDDGDRDGCKRRVRRLRELGIEDAVRAMTNDANKDVQERVKTALRQIAKAGT